VRYIWSYFVKEQAGKETERDFATYGEDTSDLVGMYKNKRRGHVLYSLFAYIANEN